MKIYDTSVTKITSASFSIKLDSPEEILLFSKLIEMAYRGYSAYYQDNWQREHDDGLGKMIEEFKKIKIF